MCECVKSVGSCPQVNALPSAANVCLSVFRIRNARSAEADEFVLGISAFGTARRPRAEYPMRNKIY